MNQENLRICLVRDTYHQILSQYANSRNNQPIINEETDEELLKEKII